MAMILLATCDGCAATAQWTATARVVNVGVDVDGNPADEGWVCDLDGDFCPECAAKR